MFPRRTPVSVRAISLSSEPANAPCEDGHLAVTSLGEGSPEGLYVVIDGHGGPEVKDFLVERLPGLVRDAVAPGRVRGGVAALSHGMSRAEQQILAMAELDQMGACMVAALITPGAKCPLAVVRRLPPRPAAPPSRPPQPRGVRRQRRCNHH